MRKLTNTFQFFHLEGLSNKNLALMITTETGKRKPFGGLVDNRALHGFRTLPGYLPA
jgi:hypothetical protein